MRPKEVIESVDKGSFSFAEISISSMRPEEAIEAVDKGNFDFVEISVSKLNLEFNH